MTAIAIQAQRVDVADLEQKVKAMYRDVALSPHAEYHFEMGRAMAERLGYQPEELDAIPGEAIDSFAGVGHHFDLADLGSGETVVDLGSGSGMDSFVAALKVGTQGRVIGIDMTDAQLAKAARIRDEAGFHQIRYRRGYIQSTGLDHSTADAVVSNGVINLAADKADVFIEAARLLKPGGRLAVSDIVTETALPESVTCDATLWAACIGGALQVDDYVDAIRSAGLEVEKVRDNPGYRFLSENARGAARRFGVRSVSILARKA